MKWLRLILGTSLLAAWWLLGAWENCIISGNWPMWVIAGVSGLCGAAVWVSGRIDAKRKKSACHVEVHIGRRSKVDKLRT